MEKSCVAIGTFDGVHKGHQGLIEEVLRISRKKGLKSVIVALSKPVRRVSGFLTELKEKREILDRVPADEVYILPVNRALINMSARDFFDKFLIGKMGARHLVVGKNFAFGHGRHGDIAWLKRNCPAADIRLAVKSFSCSHGKVISSSRIRTLLHQGRIEFASKLLGRLYSFEGTHIKGRGLGRKLGIPTINLQVFQAKLLPLGVFLVTLEAGGKFFPGIANIGTRPTFFKHGGVVPEINLLGFCGRWKNRKVRVYLLKHLRKERRFSNVNELKKQLNKDMKRAGQYFTDLPIKNSIYL
jgi:riboflavin kinase/FMN adenylyltransferase